MNCKVRMYHFELEEASSIVTDAEKRCISTEITFKKVDDRIMREANVYWDENMYIPIHMKDRVIQDLKNYTTMVPLTDKDMVELEHKIRYMLKNLYDMGHLSPESEHMPTDDPVLVLYKDPMYDYY